MTRMTNLQAVDHWLSWTHDAPVPAAGARRTDDLPGSRNLRVDGPVLYSYEEPIARLLQAPDGSTWALVRSEDAHTCTHTAKCHRSMARVRAHRSGHTVVEVPELFPTNPQDHAFNVHHLLTEADKLLTVSKRARSRGSFWRNQSTNLRIRANHYARAFRVNHTPQPTEVHTNV